MLVTWGIVPIQAGIFSTETIRLSSEAIFVQSTGYIPASEQSERIDSRYIYSTHGIIWLNETLPPFMTRDYALAPFRPLETAGTISHENQTWTSLTTLYSLDINCEVPGVELEEVVEKNGKSSTIKPSRWVSSNGCEYPTMYYKNVGNETIGPNPELGNSAAYDIKEYGSIYIGYAPTDWTDYYLKGYCPETANHTFMAWFTKNKLRADDPPTEVTRLYCNPSYYEQKVNATVNARTKAPISYTVVGDRQVLPLQKWNSSLFETQMNTGRVNEFNRERSLPLSRWPDQLETLSTYPISLGNYASVLQPLAGYAIGTNQGPLGGLLDPQVLAAAYQSAYRIIFARSMLEILDQDYGTTSNTSGHSDYVAAAIVVVPLFTYIVEALLGLVSVCGIVLVCISWRRTWSLCSDPATIASVQSLIANNALLLREFSKLDKANKEELATNLENRKFRLECDKKGSVITEVESVDSSAHGPVLYHQEESQKAKPVRPKEFRSFAVLPFVLLQIALAIALGVLLRQSQPFGIIRPSDSPITRQILENYIPTALATLIEPIWILINRLLCMLQPLDELRGGHAVASRSIDADYSSLPPQLVIFKALKSSHFKLATVCTMALLANFLAVAFSGMFNERSVLVPQTLQLSLPYQAKFIDINGTVSADMSNRMSSEEELAAIPSGAYRGGSGINQFLVAESNYTTGNPLPAWTDNEFMYIPFMRETDYNKSQAVQARTFAFGSTLECSTIPDTNYDIVLGSDGHYGGYTNVSITMLDNSTNNHFTCSHRVTLQRGPASVSGIRAQCVEGSKLGIELVLRLDPLKNATRAERNFCQQTAFLIYARGEHNWCVQDFRNGDPKLNNSNAMVVGCQPKLVAGQADVLVDANGRVEEVRDLDVSSSLSSEFMQQHFTNGTAAGGANDLIAQAHGYLFNFQGRQFHNDSFATDFINYFMLKQSNNSQLLNPKAPLPTLQDITERLYPVYRKLFAIWLGLNKDRLLVPYTDSSAKAIEGQTHVVQIRIFLSNSLFIMAEIILGVYAIAAICVYLWRPGKFLPRMPTSIAAVITLFAASEAVEDMRDTALFTRQQRRRHLENLGATYGYGSFVGADGLPHEGIEKEPLVTAVPLPGVVEKIQTGFSQKSLGIRRSN